MTLPNKRRVLKEFRLDEISLVDVPAQEGAIVALMKRADGRKAIPFTVCGIWDGNSYRKVVNDSRVAALTFAEALELEKAKKPKPEEELTEEVDDDEPEEDDEEEKPMSKSLPFGKAEIEARTAELQRNDRGLSESMAMQKAIARLAAEHGVYGKLFMRPESACYEDDANEISKDGADAVREFDKCVNEIAARDKCARSQAMHKARKAHPAEFAAYQQAE